MADFPPNLDDGELWLPSDILPKEVSSKFYPNFPSELTYMEELAQQLLLEQNQTNIKPPPNLAPNLKVRPPNRFCSIAPPRPELGLGFGGGTVLGHNLYVSGNGGSYFGSRPVYQYHAIKPVQTQVGNFVQARALVLQRQQNQVQNRFLPFQVNGSWKGGFVRESGGGTGVFLPRIGATTTYPRKKHSGKKGEEMIKQRGPVKKVAVGKEDQPPPEMGLPQEWTY
ncbi:hypothetical protein BVC80_1289g53 [Macleaya cordata]|uniref:Uncharacterized protein n=1 Tax=Macleaya cordata TaxID=56857 RepID=A0A200Q9L8_MACCD|nr:hypothetical protein BVC80_1289g53 [Macleaya cordata]